MFRRFVPFPGKDKSKSPSMRISEEYQKYGTKDGLFHSFFGPLSNIVCVGPEVVKQVMLNPKKFPKKTFGGFAGTQMGDFLGQSILWTEGEEWKAVRHIINPAFYK